MSFLTNKSFKFLFIFLLNYLLTIKIALAANLEVKPTKLFLNKNNKVATLQIKNLSNSEAIIQVSKYKWDQANNENILDRTNDLISSPAMFKLPGNHTQILRIGSRNLKETDKEQSYRIILQEVHTQDTKEKMGLKVKLQISIPLFISPNTTQNPESKDLTWSFNTKEKNMLNITAKNNSNIHRTVNNLTFLNSKNADKSKNPKELKTFIYLLPNKSFTWNIDINKLKKHKNISKGTYALNATTDLGSNNVLQDIVIN